MMNSSKERKRLAMSEKCKDGPLHERSCTDCFCCFMYLLLILAVLSLALVYPMIQAPDKEKLETSIKNSILTPWIKILQQSEIILGISGIFTAALSLALVVLTLLIPIIIKFLVFFYMAISFLGFSIFALRYFNFYIPLLSQQIQYSWFPSQSIGTIIFGGVFLIGFLLSLLVMGSKTSELKHCTVFFSIIKIFLKYNCSVIFISVFFSCLSIGAVIGNIKLLIYSHDVEKGQSLLRPQILAGLIVLEAFWTHGFLLALSDFVNECFAVNWYFDRENRGSCHIVCQSCIFLYKHIGTVAYGHILMYMPSVINTLFVKFQESCATLYKCCCFIHRIFCNNMVKYCYVKTILQSYSFCPSNKQVFRLMTLSKIKVEQLYLFGNFYLFSSAIFVLQVVITLCHFLIMQQKTDLSRDYIHLALILGITLFFGLEIVCHFFNPITITGDTLLFLYAADLQLQNQCRGEDMPLNCPGEVEEVLYRLKLSIENDQNDQNDENDN